MKKPTEPELSKLTEEFDKLLIRLISEDLRQLKQQPKPLKVYFHSANPYHYFRPK